MEFLVGSSLAAAAGLNAWVPLLAMGLLARFTDLVTLPSGWAWISGDIALWIIGGMLAVEVVADKIPALDSVNDVIQTAIRPAAGGVVFGAGANAEALKLDDPSALTETNWLPIITGVGIALVVHVMKALARPVANVATAGAAAPVVSTVEDVASVTMSVLALLLPVLAILLTVAVIVALVVFLRKRRRRGRAPQAV